MFLCLTKWHGLEGEGVSGHSGSDCSRTQARTHLHSSTKHLHGEVDNLRGPGFRYEKKRERGHHPKWQRAGTGCKQRGAEGGREDASKQQAGDSTDEWLPKGQYGQHRTRSENAGSKSAKDEEECIPTAKRKRKGTRRNRQGQERQELHDPPPQSVAATGENGWVVRQPRGREMFHWGAHCERGERPAVQI